MKDFIIMSNRELHRAEIIQKLIDKRPFEYEAAAQLGLSVRQVRRLKKAYLTDGVKALISKKRNRPSNVSALHRPTTTPHFITKSFLRVINFPGKIESKSKTSGYSIKCT